MLDWLLDKGWDSAKDFLKDGFDFRKALVVFSLLILFALAKYHQQVKQSSVNLYGRLRQREKLKKLRLQIEEVHNRLYVSLKKLNQNKEIFRERLDEIARKVDLDQNLTDEINLLGEIYQESLEDVDRLFNSVSDALDRADEMDATRDSRFNGRVEKALKRKQERQNIKSRRV